MVVYACLSVFSHLYWPKYQQALNGSSTETFQPKLVRFLLHVPANGVINVITAADAADAVNLFTIDADNNITAYDSAQQASQADAAGLVHFHSQATLAKVSRGWPMSRFVEIWNGIPGKTPVNKFQDRKKAITRVWSSIQSLAGDGDLSESTAEKPDAQREAGTPAKRSREKCCTLLGKASCQTRQNGSWKWTMLSLRQRLRRLERAPYFQRPPVSFNPIMTMALKQMTDEHLELLILVARDREAGLCRTLSQTESEAVAAYGAAVDLIRAGDRR